VALDIIGTGDVQLLERKFRLSRKMLEVCLGLGFPVFVLERSPLLLRDLGLPRAIEDLLNLTNFYICFILYGLVSDRVIPNVE
jgi:hypothetical protein